MPKAVSSTKRNERKAAPKRSRKAQSPSPGTDDESIGDEDLNLDVDDSMIDQADDGSADDASIGDESLGDDEDGVMDEDDLDHEEENQEGIEEDEEEPKAGPSKPPQQSSKGNHRNLYAPPTLDELDNLSSTSSASFTLQLSALLQSTLLPIAPHSSLKTLLTELHSTINTIPSSDAIAPREGVKKVGLPTISPLEFMPRKVNWTVAYAQPKEVFVSGSWSVVGGYKTGKGEQGGVDMVLVMPDDLFTPKDRLDYRYFYKRGYYLGIVKSNLEKAFKSKNALGGATVTWDSQDERRPVIAISVGKEQGLKHRLTIRIHASPPHSLFAPTSLSPSRSLLRHADLDQSTPTPNYSNSLLHDTLHKSTLLHLHHLSTSLNGRVVDSFLALWRIWCTRRGIRRERGGSGWFGQMVLGWVINGGEIGSKGLKRRGLGKGLGYWGALRAVWEFLAQTEFSQEPVFMACDDPAIPREEMVKANDQVFVDPTGTLNLLAGWDKGDLELLRYHARQTLVMLEDSSVDSFAEVFLRSHTLPIGVFDDFFQIDTTDIKIPEDLHARSELIDDSGRAINYISPILRKALSDRIDLLHLAPSTSGLTIGLVYNTSHATRVLDVGPATNQTVQVEAFRKLWGDKAELRRFKDGSIAESIVWDIARPEEASRIPGRIVQHILSLHAGLSEIDIKALSSDQAWSSIIQTPHSAREGIAVNGAEKLGFRPIMESYDELYKLLKDVDDELPLAILNVSPVTEMLRYSAPFIPHPVDLTRLASAPQCLQYIPSAKITVQFESSPRWPDDLSAIQKVKMALFDKLATLIESKLRGSKAKIVFDSSYSEIEDHVSLEVLLPKGVSFRLRIFHEKEKTLLERSLEDQKPAFGTALPTPPRRLVLPAIEKHMYRFIHAPKHHHGLAPLHHKYPSFSTATRLVKRWFAAHMLSFLVATEAVELLVTSTYLDSGPLSSPASGTTGFIRTIQKLANWEWRSEPLLVPLFADREVATSRPRFDPELRKIAVEAFEKRSTSTGESRAWCIATEDDLEGYRWTKGVSRVIAGRISVLAQATISALGDSVTLAQGVNVTSLFTTPLNDYDAILHLNPAIISTYAQAINPNPAEWEGKTFRNLVASKEPVLVDYNPVTSFVNDLQRLYSESALIFYDKHGGSVIGLLWNPEKEQPRALKAFLGYSTKPAGGEAALVSINKDAILGVIARLGSGIVERIELKAR